LSHFYNFNEHKFDLLHVMNFIRIIIFIMEFHINKNHIIISAGHTGRPPYFMYYQRVSEISYT